MNFTFADRETGTRWQLATQLQMGMSMETRRREFLTTLSVGLLGTRLAGAQTGSGGAPHPPVRKAKPSTLFKSPEGYPNAITATAHGLWIGEQKTDNACLVDWKGKLLKTVKTESKNTSGMGVGGGYIWMGANTAPNGIFQTGMRSKTIAHRQIPLDGRDRARLRVRSASASPRLARRRPLQLRCWHPPRLGGKQEPHAWICFSDRSSLAHGTRDWGPRNWGPRNWGLENVRPVPTSPSPHVPSR